MFAKQVGERLVAAFTDLTSFIEGNQDLIKDAEKIAKEAKKNKLDGGSARMAEINEALDNFNEQIYNLIVFIRGNEQGEHLEGLAVVLEEIRVKNFSDTLIDSNGWFNDKSAIEEFQKKLSLDNVDKMVRDIFDASAEDMAFAEVAKIFTFAA